MNSYRNINTIVCITFFAMSAVTLQAEEPTAINTSAGGYICEVTPTKNVKDLVEELRKQGCQKDDVLIIHEKMRNYGKLYYRRAAAAVCDFSKGFGPAHDHHIMCFYQGFVRPIRSDEKNFRDW